MASATSTPISLAQVLHVEANCVCLNIRKAARVVTQRYDAALAPAGIRSTQYGILVAVAGLQPVSMSDLAARIVMDRTTLTRNLRPLLDAGLLTMTEGSDRRRREIELMPAGGRVLAEAFRLWKRVQSTTTAMVGVDRLDAILTDLDAAVSALGEA